MSGEGGDGRGLRSGGIDGHRPLNAREDPRGGVETCLLLVNNSGCCGPSHDVPINLPINIFCVCTYLPYLLGQVVFQQVGCFSNS